MNLWKLIKDESTEFAHLIYITYLKYIILQKFVYNLDFVYMYLKII